MQSHRSVGLRYPFWSHAIVMVLAVLSAIAQPGQLDASFAPPTVANYRAVWPRADGKLLVMVPKDQLSWSENVKVLRLSVTGAIDPTFNPELPANFEVSHAVPRPDERIIVAGRFTNDPTELKLLRLFANGGLDSSFQASLDVPKNLNFSVGILPDADKIWIRGDFQKVNGTDRSVLARLHPDGALDSSFEIKTNANWIDQMTVQDGKLIVQATFTEGDVAITRPLRLLSDGSIDSTFRNQLAYGNTFVDSSGRILVAGYQWRPPGMRIILWRLLPNGEVDPEFHEVSSDGNIYSAAFQPDGKIIVTGYFDYLNGQPRNKVARLNPDGSIDSTFNTGFWSKPNTHTGGAAIQPDGRILISGVAYSDMDFSDPNGLLVRFWSDEYIKFNDFWAGSRHDLSGRLTNTTARQWILESSSDLLSWQSVSTNEPSISEIRLDGFNGENEKRFYRGVIR